MPCTMYCNDPTPPSILTNIFAVGLCFHDPFSVGWCFSCLSALQKGADNRFIRSVVVNGKAANVAASSTPKVGEDGMPFFLGGRG